MLVFFDAYILRHRVAWFCNSVWDMQIWRDACYGRLDKLAFGALEEYMNGDYKELNLDEDDDAID